MCEEPYYGLFACGLNKIFSDQLDTAGVGVDGINYVLLINKDFWYKLSEDSRYGVLKHELLHLCFFHVTDGKDMFGAICPDHRLLNIAMDLEVQSYIDNKYLIRDENNQLVGIADKLFVQFPSLRKQMGTKYYINFLKQLKDCTNDKKAGQGEDGKTQTGDKPDEDQTQKEYDRLSDKEKQQLKDNLQTEEELHKTWEKIWDGLTDEQKELIKRQAEFQMKETAKNVSKGDIPSELRETIDRLFKPKAPIFNWKAYFRRLLGVHFDIYQKKTRRKESLRFEDSPGLKFRKKHKILVAIDTSGSVCAEEFRDFFSEIYHIYKAGAQIHVIEADAAISNEYDYKGVMPEKISGRGGTSFIPAVNYYNEHRNEYTSCVYFTDGYGDQERCKPLGKMIWIITSDGYQNGSYPGVKICIPKTNKKD